MRVGVVVELPEDGTRIAIVGAILLRTARRKERGAGSAEQPWQGTAHLERAVSAAG